MSFIRGAFSTQPLHTVEQYVVNDIAVAEELNMPNKWGAVICSMMCKFQEAGADLGDGKGRQIWCPGNDRDPHAKDFPSDSWGDDSLSVGSYQQQTSSPGVSPPWGWGGLYGDPEGTRKRMDMYESTKLFMAALKKSGYNAGDAANANASVQRVQQSGVPNAYAQWYDLAIQTYNRVVNGGTLVAAVTPKVTPNPKWRGDPLFLPDILRAFGVDVATYPAWDQRGHGDFGKIDWVLWHHTGSVNETDQGIAQHPALGLAANMLIHPDGRVVLTGAGVAWHGGEGIYPGIPENNINQISIGIECSYGPDRQGKYTIPWPDKQMVTMVAVGAAISWFLGLPPSRNIAHKEWAGADNPLGINKQGKPDPGNLNMGWFRGEITKRLEQGPTGIKEILTPEQLKELNMGDTQITVPYKDPNLETLIQTRGRFAMLGNRTLIEATSALLLHAGLINQDQYLQPGVVLD